MCLRNKSLYVALLPFPSSAMVLFLWRQKKENAENTVAWRIIIVSQGNSRKEEKHDGQIKLSTNLQTSFPGFYMYYTVMHIFHLQNLHSDDSATISIHSTP